MVLPNLADVVRAAAGGDRTSFELLVTHYAAVVTGVAYSVCGDFALSEDIGQDALIDAWKNLPNLREPEKFLGWLCTIVRFRAADALRNAQSNRARSSLEQLELDPVDPKQLLPETAMSQEQERQWVWTMLESLPADYREPMVLFYRCGQSTREVALALDESEPTIRQRLKRGRDLLRNDMTESIRKTLCDNAPATTFVAIVMASLPPKAVAASVATTGTATSAAATSTFASKSVGLGGATATSGIGGALLGSLVGIAGGVLGTWMSWKNCEYESQQKFVIRQALLFLVGLALFGILLTLLTSLRVMGIIESATNYAVLIVMLLVGSQALNLIWIWHGIHAYKRVGLQARANGEPMRACIREQRETLRQRSQVIRADGSVGYEAFQWNASAWWGSTAGSLAWMIPLSFIAFTNGSTATACIGSTCCLLGATFAAGLWWLRSKINAYLAYQLLIANTFVIATITFAAVQWLANQVTLQQLQWTSWGWGILIIFPVMSVAFYWQRRNFETELLT